ncbi:MAG: hypothetical protein E7619_08155 [Ruminococcaceae bacterium]|nr:hypothetical protein [Oscillospiraceae bacterium]
MRLVAFFALFAVACCLLGTDVFAEERTYTYTPEESNIGDDVRRGIEDAIPEGISLPEDTVKNAVNSGDVDAEALIKELLTSAKDELTAPVRLFFSLAMLACFAAIFKALSDSVRGKGVATAFSLCSSLCFALALLSPVMTLLDRCSALLRGINDFLLALTPVFSSLCAAGGSVAGAAYVNSGAYMITVLTDRVFLDVLLPLCKIIFAVGLTASVSSLDLSGVTKLLKDGFTTAMAFFMMINTAVFSLGNQIAAAKDGIAIRTVRFAAGSFIPVVGGAVSEVMRTVAGSLALIKSGAGWVCSAVILLMLVPPLVSVLLHRTAIELASAVARICSLNSEARLLDGAVVLCNLLAALMAASSVLFVLAVTVFTKTAVTV